MLLVPLKKPRHQVSIGQYLMGALQGRWGTGDVVSGLKVVDRVCTPFPSTGQVDLEVVWYELNLSGDLSRYQDAIDEYNVGLTYGGYRKDIINSIAVKYFKPEVHKTHSQDDQWYTLLVLTAFLQTAYANTTHLQTFCRTVH